MAEVQENVVEQTENEEETAPTGENLQTEEGKETTEVVTKKNGDAKDTEESSAGSGTKKARVDYSGMTTRPYLDATLVPILLQALSAVAKERPADPIQYLADFLIAHKEQYSQVPDVTEETSG